jgi:hypothetical protein
MHLIELVIQYNALSGRKHITPLGWILGFIVALFVGALAFGWYRQITRNVNAMETVSSVAMAQVATPTSLPIPPTASAKNGAVDWSVKVIKTPLGLDMIQAPPKVTEQVLKNYDEALNDWDAHKFELDYLKTRAPEYFIGKQLARMRGMLNWMQREGRAIPLREYELLPLERSVQYAPNGTQTFLIEYIAAGKTYEYDLNTRKKIDEQELPDRIVITELSYDAAAKRWKISRIALAMDFNTKQILWRDQ